MSEEELVAELRKAIDAVIEELKSEPVEEFVEGALEIRRVQSYHGDWETLGYRLLLAYGGPCIWLDTYEGVVEGDWGTARVKLPIPDELAKKVEDYLNAVLP